ncbi:MAG: hypothetical protein H0X33_06660 [Taibaiella sp.]|nr:hypothetical protein [Taibaiella sp.]
MKLHITSSPALLFLALAFLLPGISFAQKETDSTTTDPDPVAVVTQQVAALRSGDSHFMMVGLATFGFVTQRTTNTLGGIKTTDKFNSLGDADRYEFSPMFLWRHGDKLLLEFEPSFNGTSIGVNWADVSYFVAPGLIVRGGYIVLPFGIYSKRLAAGWINKLASDPVGINAAGSDFGVEIEGGLPLGNMKWSYDVAVSNGFQLNPDGTTAGVGISAINNGKTVSGRLALLPFSNSSLEIGVSGLYGSLATPTGSTATYNNPLTSIYGFDLNFVKNLSPIQINIKGQYNISNVNSQRYISPADTTQSYTFTNTTNAAFGQVSIRPTQSKNKVLKNVELAFRYVSYTTPNNSTWGQKYSEQDYGLDYWLSWRTVLKFTYENIKSDGTSSVDLSGAQGSTSIHRMILQFSTGL